MKKIILIIGLTLVLTFFCLQGRAFAETNINPKLRYISLAPSTTEILFALGLDEEIIGVSSYCNYPLRAKIKEKVGTFSRANIEKILSLRPDYIFCTGLEQTPIVTELRRLNLKVYVSDPANMQELFNSIRDIAKITGKVKEAQELIKQMENQIEEITSKVKLIPRDKRQTVFIEIWHTPLTTAGRGSFVNELLTLAGGINIANDTKRIYSIFSQEAVIKRNPDSIILAYMTAQEKPAESLRGRLGWSGISAVKNNRIYSDINPDILLRPGPRAVEGIKEVYKKLYP